MRKFPRKYRYVLLLILAVFLLTGYFVAPFGRTPLISLILVILVALNLFMVPLERLKRVSWLSPALTSAICVSLLVQTLQWWPQKGFIRTALITFLSLLTLLSVIGTFYAFWRKPENDDSCVQRS